MQECIYLKTLHYKIEISFKMCTEISFKMCKNISGTGYINAAPSFSINA